MPQRLLQSAHANLSISVLPALFRGQKSADRGDQVMGVASANANSDTFVLAGIENDLVKLIRRRLTAAHLAADALRGLAVVVLNVGGITKKRREFVGVRRGVVHGWSMGKINYRHEMLLFDGRKWQLRNCSAGASYGPWLGTWRFLLVDFEVIFLSLVLAKLHPEINVRHPAIGRRIRNRDAELRELFPLLVCRFVNPFNFLFHQVVNVHRLSTPRVAFDQRVDSVRPVSGKANGLLPLADLPTVRRSLPGINRHGFLLLLESHPASHKGRPTSK